MKTIFITIPSYEDSDLLPTIQDAIAKAANPESLYFAIALQYKKIPLPDLSEYYDNPNFSFISYDVDTRPGVNQVRHNLLKFYNGQDYYMMIDSHTRFMQDWDRVIIDDYKNLQSKEHNKIAFSRHMDAMPGEMCICNTEEYNRVGFCHGHDRIPRWQLGHAGNGDIDILTLHSIIDVVIDESLTNQDFAKTHYVSCSFLFVDAVYIDEVGILDNLSYLGEEPSQGIRAFYAGWDVYAPMKTAYIQHNSSRYDMELYGKESGTFQKMYATSNDYYNNDANQQSLINLYINNTGEYRIKNPSRTPKDFFTAVGLGDKFNQYIDNPEYQVYLREYAKVGYGPGGILRFPGFISKYELSVLEKYVNNAEIVGSTSKREIQDQHVVEIILGIEERLASLVSNEYLNRYDIRVKEGMRMGGLDLVKWEVGNSLPIHSDTEDYKRQPILLGGWYKSNITVIIYITNNFEGGELVFPEFDLEIKPNAGELFVYPGRYRHKVNKLLSGKRYTAIGAFEFDVISGIEEMIDSSIEDPSKLLFEGYED
jgi:hypothetical protein